MSDFSNIQKCPIVRTQNEKSYYEGEYVEGLEDGYGVLRWPSG